MRVVLLFVLSNEIVREVKQLPQLAYDDWTQPNPRLTHTKTVLFENHI